jgi:SAM-dependent methyltransferase
MTPSPQVDRSSRAVPVALPARWDATERLYARLSSADVAAVEERLEPAHRDKWLSAEGPARRQLTLLYGVWYRVPGVLERTGLRPDEPPEHVHAMARGPLAAGGSSYDADMIAEAVEGAGTPMDEVRRALDFGCSSGRALRALAAAWPAIEWHGVDPNADAVAWASEHVPGASFGQSPTDPPLGFDGHAFDLVYAISIWSHFGEDAARRWLDEMHRLLRPGGLLVMTVHGYRSVEHAAEIGSRPPRQLEQIRRALYRTGFWFAPEFGEDGDHGVKHRDWGTSFMTAEWLTRQVAPRWLVANWAVGRNSGNQDVVTLIRRS